MAIYNGRILMRKGNEADFDAEKLMAGEWAVSLDKGIVRICLEAGRVIRMATYEAFEEDMKQIEAILLECQTIEEAVQRINTEINAKVDAVVEYVGQAKTYRDEALQFRNEAESFKNQAGEIAGIGIATTEKAGIVKPDGETLEVDADGTMRVIGGGGVSDYKELDNKPSINGTELDGDMSLNDLGIASATELEKTNTKVDTIIDKADLGIKETASGEEIHLTDSAEGKAVEFALYGKAKQNTTSGKNLLENKATSQTINGVEFVVNEDKSITLNGTASASIGNYYLTQENMNLDNMVATCVGINGLSGIYFAINNGTTTFNVFGSKKEASLNGSMSYARIYVDSGATFNNVTIYPMIRLASITDDTYEPFTNGASPNPQYPQPIEVSGESGSVVVKSVGKNFLSSTAISKEINGITWTVNNDKTITANGTATGNSTFLLSDIMISNVFPKKILTSTKTTYALQVDCYNGKTFIGLIKDSGEIPSGTNIIIPYIRIRSGETVNNLIFYPMIRACDENGNPIDDDTYEPYKETLATIPTENGLCGIKVSSNGNYTDQNGQQWICDEIVKYADGSGERIQRIWKEFFDGSEDKVWMLDSGATIGNRYIYQHTSKMLRSDLTNGVKSLNSNFGLVKNGGTYTNTNCYTVSPESIMVSLNGTETLQEFKEYLASKPMTVLTALETPIVTPLTAEEIAEIEKLHTFYPVTNISNDFDCGMRIEYVGDSIITTNTEIPIVEPKDEEELESGDNIVTLFGKIKKKLKIVEKGVVDVVDNLLSTSTTLPLSANQGRVLDEKISTLNESLENYGKMTLLATCTSSSFVNVKLSDNINNYRYILFALERPTGSTHQSMSSEFYPLEFFKIGYQNLCHYMDTQSLRLGRAQYIDDTTVEMEVTSGYSAVIYGIK